MKDLNDTELANLEGGSFCLSILPLLGGLGDLAQIAADAKDVCVGIRFY